MDVVKDDLVLHEGDGNIQRPSRLKTSGKAGNKPKKMPSPRKATPATINGKAGTKTKKLPSQAAKKPDVDSSETQPASQKPKDKNNIEKIRQKPNLEVPNVLYHGESFGEGESDFEDWDEDDRRGRNFRDTNPEKSSPELTSEDIEICKRLDDEYERALEERDIGYNARYSSVRQTALWSVFFLALYMVQGTYVYRILLLTNNEEQNDFVARIDEDGNPMDEFDNQLSSWSIPESLLFSIFTITTVGYGREDLPATPSFQAYTIVYIMVGIAALTIMTAQVYQCIALEASRARLSRDKQDELRRRSGLMLKEAKHRRIQVAVKKNRDRTNSDEIIAQHVRPGLVSRTMDCCFGCLDRAKFFFRETEVGKGISVIFPLSGLILSGACVVCPLEGWTFLESLYFAVVSMTTVGFGDYVPTKLPTIWFCIFWLPLSIGFMSMYLGNVATFYIRLSDRNIRRIERHLRRRLQKAKEKAEEERAEILRRAYRGQEVEIEIAAVKLDRGNIQRSGSMDSNESTESNLATIPKNHARSVMKRKKQEGFNMLPTTDDTYSSDDETVHIGVVTASNDNKKIGEATLRETGYRRRQKIIDNCRASPSLSNRGCYGESVADSSIEPENDRTMKSMKDVIIAVRSTLESKNNGTHHPVNPGEQNASKFMSIQSTQNMIDYSMFRRQKQSKKPSFALRVLVQERFAEIIAIEVAGYHSMIEIKDYTLSVTFDTMSDTAEKWSIPRRARKAFRAVAFEILYFVGEHGLITRGAEALYELTPFEFHGLFSTLVAAMGDADIMEGWLARTDALAMADLQQGVLHRSAPDHGTGGRRKRVFSID